jgi:hypothetical protein
MKYRKGVVLPLSRNCFSIALLFFVCNAPGAYPQAVIIDHTCTDLSLIPVEYINNARGQFRVGYGHTSHGSQITTGMELINSPPYYFNGDGAGGALSYQETSGDLGGDWVAITRALLNSPGNNRNVIIWSWCGQVSGSSEADIAQYLNSMSQLENDYPGVTFVYMTGHLDGTGTGGGLNVRNNQIRSYCIANNKVLLDFADIERYDPNGTDYLNLGGGTGGDGDGCQYNSGNWGIEWCAAHPGSDLCAGDNSCIDCGCAHSVYLNCNLKGRAFWWMMARLAGWQGTSPGPTPTPPPPVAPPITLHTNKTAFSTSDTIVITVDVRATANFTPYIRFALPDGSYLYLIRGGRVARGAQPFMKGPLTLGADIAGYGVARITFSGIAPRSYALQGALVGSGGIIDGVHETALIIE